MNVPTTVDGSVENNESVIAEISNITGSPAGISIGISSATGTIVDNCTTNSGQLDVSGFAQVEGTTANFVIDYSGDTLGSDLIVNYTITDGSAVAGDDYNDLTPSTGQVTIPAGATSANVAIELLNDMLVEADETFDITLTTASLACVTINTANATGTITDDCTTNSGQLDVSGFAQVEGTTANFVIDYSGDTLGSDLIVNYTITDGSAVAGDDYNDLTPSTGQVTIPAGATSANVAIELLNDMLVEADETFDITLTTASLACVTINTANATGTITDDDGNGPNEGISVSDFTVSESDGTANFVITYSGNEIQNAFNVNFLITEVTAITPEDYALVNTNTFVSFPANTQDGATQTVTLSIVDDVIIESAENLNISLSFDPSPPVGINMLDDNGQGTITDNDSDSDFPSDMVVNCDAIPPVPVITLNAVGCNYTEVFDEQITGQDDGCDTEYTITRTWTVTDCVGNIREHVQIITVEDNEAPTFVEALPADSTVSCDAIPVAEVLTAIDNCDTNASVSFEEQISDNDSCPSDYIITRTWTAEDCAGNQTIHTQTIRVEDTEAPSFVESLPANMVALCNEVPDAETLTAIDNCDPNITVTFNEVITNDANCMDGYTVTRVWTAIDCAGNENSHTQVITIEPTGPIMAGPYDEEITIMCGDPLPEIPNLEFTGGCGNYTVDFTEDTTSLDATDDYMIVRTWEVTDSCGNMATFMQTIFVMQYQLEEINIEICVEDDPINLLDYLPGPFDTNGTFEIRKGNVAMEGSTFNPANLEVGEYIIAYSSENGPCQFFAEYSIIVNSDCVPCSRGEIEVNDAITVNGDGINDFLEITGVEYCAFSFDIMVFNRWGDKVFEQTNYQNTWGGTTPGGAFGSSDTLPSGTYYYIITVWDVTTGENLEPLNGYIYLGTK